LPPSPSAPALDGLLLLEPAAALFLFLVALLILVGALED
jgi:hypothetical protein